MIELNESQAEFMKQLAGDSPFQVVVRANQSDTPEKKETYDKLNKETDILIAAGFVQDVSMGIPKPENYDRDFRVVGITLLGASFFGETGAAKA